MTYMSTSTQTIAQSNGILIKKKKTQSKKGKIPFRGLVLPILVLLVWQMLGSIGILPAQLFSSPFLIIASFIELIQSGELQHIYKLV